MREKRVVPHLSKQHACVQICSKCVQVWKRTSPFVSSPLLQGIQMRQAAAYKCTVSYQSFIIHVFCLKDLEKLLWHLWLVNITCKMFPQDERQKLSSLQPKCLCMSSRKMYSGSILKEVGKCHSPWWLPPQKINCPIGQLWLGQDVMCLLVNKSVWQ